jgi:hypothetical protein
MLGGAGSVIVWFWELTKIKPNRFCHIASYNEIFITVKSGSTVQLIN